MGSRQGYEYGAQEGAAIVELIAEVSSNHGGDLALAKAFIQAYAEAGADWIKFQSYQVATLRPDDPQRAWLAQAELTDDAHHVLKAECERVGVRFLTTAFHVSRVPFLASLGLAAIKIGSGEAGETALRDAVGVFPRVLVSMGTLKGQTVPGGQARDYEWLRCVSRYPASRWMCRQRPYNAFTGFNEVGWSDHCVGIEVCEEAIFHGARVIEKHVSLPGQPRAKRPFEATVEEFAQLRAFANADPDQYLGRWQYAG